MQRTIRIENVGPIGRLTFPLPDAGVVVLRGRNGTGKSHAFGARRRYWPSVRWRIRPACAYGLARRSLVTASAGR